MTLDRKLRDLIIERFKRTAVTGAVHEQAQQPEDEDEEPEPYIPPPRAVPRASALSPARQPAQQAAPPMRFQPQQQQQQAPPMQTEEEYEQPVAAPRRSQASVGVDPAMFDLGFEDIRAQFSAKGRVPSGSSVGPAAAAPVAPVGHALLPSVSSLAPLTTTEDVGQNVENIELYSEVENFRIDSMRAIWQRIKKDGALVIQPHTDRLVGLLVVQIRLSFESQADGSGLRLRLCKYALNLLLEVFQEARVAEDMQLSTHEDLSRELLLHLTELIGKSMV